MATSSPSHPPEESTALLAKPASARSDGAEAPQRRQWQSEVWLLAKAAVPVILAYTLQNSLQTVSVVIVGRLSPEALATAAFSYIFAMSTAWLIALGGTTVLDALAASSFTGSQDKHDLGILLQRGILFYAVVAAIWVFSEPLFRALSQEDFICVQSPRFLRILIPGGLGYVWFECLKKYLQAQEVYRQGTYVLLITSPLSALLNFLFCHRLGMVLDGAPLATGIAYWCSFFLLAAYTAFVRGHECWGGLAPRRALVHLWPFTRLAILGFVHVGTEWWAFKIVALAAGRLGTVSLAAQSVIMTADQIINTIPFGLGVATSARVGNFLEAQKPREAARTAHCAALLSAAVGAVILAMLMSAKGVFGRAFNDDKEVVGLVGRVMPFVALFQIADGLNGSCGGTLRGMGKQWIGALVNLLSYYADALPAGIYLAFHGHGLAGLWIGQCAALYLVGILEWIIVGMSDWEKECQQVLARLADDGLDVRVHDDGGNEV